METLRLNEWQSQFEALPELAEQIWAAAPIPVVAIGIMLLLIGTILSLSVLSRFKHKRKVKKIDDALDVALQVCNAELEEKQTALDEKDKELESQGEILKATRAELEEESTALSEATTRLKALMPKLEKLTTQFREERAAYVREIENLRDDVQCLKNQGRDLDKEMGRQYSVLQCSEAEKKKLTRQLYEEKQGRAEDKKTFQTEVNRLLDKTRDLDVRLVREHERLETAQAELKAAEEENERLKAEQASSLSRAEPLAATIPAGEPRPRAEMIEEDRCRAARARAREPVALRGGIYCNPKAQAASPVGGHERTVALQFLAQAYAAVEREDLNTAQDKIAHASKVVEYDTELTRKLNKMGWLLKGGDCASAISEMEECLGKWQS